MANCSTCGEYIWTRRGLGAHQCAPQWDWRANDWHAEDEWSEVSFRARSAEEAAEKAAEMYDQEDFNLIRNASSESVTTIFVRESGTTGVTRWQCSGEVVAVYHARQLTEESAE